MKLEVSEKESQLSVERRLIQSVSRDEYQTLSSKKCDCVKFG